MIHQPSGGGAGVLAALAQGAQAATRASRTVSADVLVVVAVLAAMRRMKTLLLIGYGAGLDDPTLATLLQWGADLFAAAGCKHYCLLTDEDVSAAPRADAKPRLVALSCGPTRAHLVPFLEALAAAVRPATP